RPALRAIVSRVRTPRPSRPKRAMRTRCSRSGSSRRSSAIWSERPADSSRARMRSSWSGRASVGPAGRTRGRRRAGGGGGGAGGRRGWEREQFLEGEGEIDGRQGELEHGDGTVEVEDLGGEEGGAVNAQGVGDLLLLVGTGAETEGLDRADATPGEAAERAEL